MQDAPKVTSPARPGSPLAPRLKAVMDLFKAEAGVSLVRVAADMGKSDRQLRAWRGGENEPSYSEIERMDRVYAGRGCPGLIDRIRAAARWHSERLTLGRETMADARGWALLDCLGDMRAAVSLEDWLAEHGLLAHVHIMLRSETDGMFITHRGSKMASAAQIDRGIYGRDIRTLAPQGYGIEVYPQVMDCLGRDEPMLHHITAPDMDYYRLAVPVGRFCVAYSHRIWAAPSFALR
ncbi:hypothetical protein [Ferrovibrio xuzhouensis]|uniref:HTH cro/C1-type domain-containing protein n=1 Tax=Ferrovibrio xuzhouensis TaxID=1576914 RepID=A0ABV7VDI9_9PROT